MNAEIKRKWVEALRSGKYQQIRRRLRTKDGFCCLGVLCDVIDDSKWEYDYLRKAYSHGRGLHSPEGFLLPESNPQFIGLKNADYELLAKMNDIEEMDFNEIANWIEKSL